MTDTATIGARRLRQSAVPLACAVFALVTLGPLLSRGYVLTYDMVFAPTQFVVADSLGLGSAPARSVPADAVVAAATHMLPGDIVQKLILFLALFLAPLGAARLVPTESVGVRLVAASAYGWTPYVAERLFMGHWPYLLAYACLPWIAMAGLAVRGHEPKALARLVLWSAPAVLTPTGGLLAAGVAFATAGRHRFLSTLGVVAVLNSPWWVPSVLAPSSPLSAPEAVGLFDARAENWGGAVLSVLGLGGFWNGEVMPASRSVPLIPILTVGLTIAALWGCREWARRAEPAATLLALGALGVFLALLSHIPFGGAVLRWAVSTIPGAALLRDAQKWVAWWALPLAIGLALAAEQAARHLPRLATLAAAALIPVLAMPDLAFAGLGRLDAVAYPKDWTDVRDLLRADERPGDVLTLPLGTFRQFAWNDHRTQLDPAPRMLSRTTIIDDTVYVAGRPIPGEDARMPAIRAAVRTRGDLGALGIGWLLVEHRTPGDLDRDLLRRHSIAYTGQWLTLYRVTDRVEPPSSMGPPRVPVLAGDFSALLIVTLSLLWLALPAGRLTESSRREE